MPTWFEIYISGLDTDTRLLPAFEYRGSKRTIEGAEDEARALLHSAGLGGRALVQSSNGSWTTDVLHIVQLSATLQGTFACREDAIEAATLAHEARQHRAEQNRR